MTRTLFVLVILAHERRRVVHVAVTDHPTAGWTAQQLREAFPGDAGPRFLIHDRDSAFHAWRTTVVPMGIEEVLMPQRAHVDAEQLRTRGWRRRSMHANCSAFARTVGGTGRRPASQVR